MGYILISVTISVWEWHSSLIVLPHGGTREVADHWPRLWRQTHPPHKHHRHHTLTLRRWAATHWVFVTYGAPFLASVSALSSFPIHMHTCRHVYACPHVYTDTHTHTLLPHAHILILTHSGLKLRRSWTDRGGAGAAVDRSQGQRHSRQVVSC